MRITSCSQALLGCHLLDQDVGRQTRVACASGEGEFHAFDPPCCETRFLEQSGGGIRFPTFGRTDSRLGLLSSKRHCESQRRWEAQAVSRVRGLWLQQARVDERHLTRKKTLQHSEKPLPCTTLQNRLFGWLVGWLAGSVVGRLVCRSVAVCWLLVAVCWLLVAVCCGVLVAVCCGVLVVWWCVLVVVGCGLVVCWLWVGCCVCVIVCVGCCCVCDCV